MMTTQEVAPEKRRTGDYATREDFQRVFTEGLAGLFQLSLLLTREHHKAEECFVAALEDAVKANNVFKEWACSWAKRAIIKNAIRLVQPHTAKSDPSLDPPPLTQLEPFRTGRNEIDNVLTLKDFERFVFVMSILERYSERECALLLACSDGEIGNTRSLALEHFTARNSDYGTFTSLVAS